MSKLIEENTNKKYSKPRQVLWNFAGWIPDYNKRWSQLSLAIRSWVGAMSTSKSWGAFNRHIKVYIWSALGTSCWCLL